MVLTLEEKEKLYEKAKKLFDSIKEIKIRKEIDVFVAPKYYDEKSRYADFGFKYYFKGSMNIFGNDIEDSLKELKNYIDFKKGIGEEYINGKSVSFLSNYTTNALLDFIYYGDKIKTDVERQNQNERKELNDLLS
jgi:hypothetical protein